MGKGLHARENIMTRNVLVCLVTGQVSTTYGTTLFLVVANDHFIFFRGLYGVQIYSFLSPHEVSVNDLSAKGTLKKSIHSSIIPHFIRCNGNPILHKYLHNTLITSLHIVQYIQEQNTSPIRNFQVYFHT